MAPREVVLGLDKTEYQVSLFGTVLAFAMALIPAIGWIRKTKVASTLKPSKSNTCISGYHLVSSTCQRMVDDQSRWEVLFVCTVVIALCMLYCTIRRKRAGVACFAFLTGFAVAEIGGITGILFFALGAWLMLRAYRLQKYGDPTTKGSNRIAKEISQAKREGREPELDVVQSGDSTVVVKKQAPKPTAAPEASKRYTPKKPQPRRR
jgi:hypothetical protein